MPPKRARPLFKPRTLVLAKMQGFPAWPSFVMPEELIPENIMRAKKKSTDYCVIFIPDGDYYWVSEKSLEELTPEELRKRIAKLPNKGKKKSTSTKRTLVVGDALMAAQDVDFDVFIKKLNANAGEEEDDDEEDEEEFELEEENEEDEEDVEEDGNGDEEEDMHNKDTESVDIETKPTGKDLRRGNGRRSRGRSAPVEVEDDAEDDGDEEEENLTHRRKRARLSTPLVATTKRRSANGSNGTIKQRNKPEPCPPKVLSEEERQHQLWLCRIKLQRSLIQRNQPITPTDTKSFPPPTVDELLIARLILHRLAEFPMNLDLLSTTKIHKVLKCILKDPDLEYPDSFKLHEKCNELLNKWSGLIDHLRQEKHRRGDARLNSQPPDDSEISGIESVKKEGESESETMGIPVTTAS